MAAILGIEIYLIHINAFTSFLFNFIQVIEAAFHSFDVWVLAEARQRLGVEFIHSYINGFVPINAFFLDKKPSGLYFKSLWLVDSEFVAFRLAFVHEFGYTAHMFKVCDWRGLLWGRVWGDIFLDCLLFLMKIIIILNKRWVIYIGRPITESARLILKG